MEVRIFNTDGGWCATYFLPSIPRVGDKVAVVGRKFREGVEGEISVTVVKVRWYSSGLVDLHCSDGRANAPSKPAPAAAGVQGGRPGRRMMERTTGEATGQPCPACGGCPQGVSGTGYPIRCMYCKGTGKAPVDEVLHCPRCGKQHLDVGEFAVRGHRTHKCENTPDGPNTGCGHEWRPYEHLTRGVLSIPGEFSEEGQG